MAFWGTKGRFGGGYQNPQFNRWRTGSGIMPNTRTSQYTAAGGADFRTDPSANYSGRGGGAFADIERILGKSGGMVDPRAVIESAQPLIRRQMRGFFSEAGNKLGAMGLRGGGTSGGIALGKAAKWASDEAANLANKYYFQAASDAANRGANANKLLAQYRWRDIQDQKADQRIKERFELSRSGAPGLGGFSFGGGRWGSDKLAPRFDKGEALSNLPTGPGLGSSHYTSRWSKGGTRWL